jgi:hypothetical protein
MKIKFKDTDKVTLSFVHIRTKEPTVFLFEKNPMTGNWLFLQNGGNPYTMTKSHVSQIAKSVISKSKDNNLSCKIKIEPSKYHKQR